MKSTVKFTCETEKKKNIQILEGESRNGEVKVNVYMVYHIMVNSNVLLEPEKDML